MRARGVVLCALWSFIMTVVLLHFISVELLKGHLALAVNTLTPCSPLRFSAQYNHFERKFMNIVFRSQWEKYRRHIC